MGANQSSKSRQQFAPDFNPTNHPASSLVQQTPSSNNIANKNSFSKKQLNRLLRKSLPTQMKSDGGGSNNKCKLNGNNNSDELVARVSSGQRQEQLLASKSPIYGHESSSSHQSNSVLDNNNPGGSNNNNKFNYSTDGTKYLVTGQQQQARLRSNHQATSSSLSKTTTTASSYDANRDISSKRHTTTASHMNPYADSLKASDRALEHDQRLILVRQQQQQQQQQQLQGNSIEHHHHNESNMTTSSPLASRQPVRQPLDSSNAYHYNHCHQAPNEQHANKQQSNNSSNNNSSTSRPNKSNMPLRLTKQKQMQQLKSSCSPSSASSSSPTSTGSSSSSTTASSSESLKLQQRQPLDATPGGIGSSNTRPSQLVSEQSTHTRISPKLNRPNEYPINQVERRQHQQLVATQQHHNRMANSSGEPLSWSKQQQEINLHSNINNNNGYQQQTLLANKSQQANHRANQYQHHNDQLAYLTLDSRQMLSPDLYRQYQQQQNQMDQKYGQNHSADELEQYYSRNLHLLTGCEPPSPQTAVTLHQHQNLNPNQGNPQHHLYASNTLGHMSAPLQRRYKWPKQQYQYLNTSAVLDSNNQNHQSAHHYYNQKQQQQQFHTQVPSSLSSNRYEDNIANDYTGTGLFMSITDNAPADNYYDQNLNVTSHHLFSPQSHRGFHVPAQSTLESASKSLRKSPAQRGKSRSRNPLAGIFGSIPTGADRDNHISSSKFGANTIHHLSSSKSHQNLQSTISRTASNSNGNASSSSLKRIRSSPLTAQQTSYEAMRTIDMYLIRQIARSCMDFEMEQKIDLEIRLRELAAQSMLEARNEIDVLEVEKSLLTSDQRMNCYASQLEQQRKRLSNPSLSTSDSGRGSKASRWDSMQGPITGTNNSASKSMGSQARQHQSRSDVIGATSHYESGSPSFSLISKSSQSSPSKLSPVSGESANSGSTSQQSPPPPASIVTGTADDEIETAKGSSGQQNRSSLSRSNHRVIRRPTSNSNTLSRRRDRSQRQKHRERLAQLISSQHNIDCNLTADTKATITLSELRVPLMWRDVDHFKGRGDYRRYAVFCLAKIGSQIYDTQLISDVDRQMTDLTFDDVIMFNNVELDFEVELEVYSCVYLEQFSLSSTPRKLMEKLSNSVGRAMGRRLATQTASVNYIKELEAYDKSYRFAMIASAKLTLVDASDSVKTYDLQLVSPEAHGRHSITTPHTTTHHNQTNGATNHQSTGGMAQAQSMTRHYQPGSNHNGIVTASNQRDLHKNTLPLFGHFCCRLHVRPIVFDDKDATSGYL
uniref:Rhotekin-2 n=1 Tax=Aceria tosichella TaxID=561515 RepID=A0A6G1SJG5_9ACAR